MTKKHKKVQILVIATHQNKKYLLRLQTNKRRGEFWQNITGSVENDESFSEAACQRDSRRDRNRISKK